ncbi:hypothetical protein EMCRGX_G023039 [Ephydatia muelleri]|eukprot:Em0017g576a
MSCIARDFTYTFQVPAGKTECFYEYVHQGAYLEIEYQVITGGELDITFLVNGPQRMPLALEPHHRDGLHAIEIKETGEYEICLDNSFSHITAKRVFLDVIIEDDEGEVEEVIVPYQLSKEAVILEMKVQDIKDSLDSISRNLSKVIVEQSFFKARESRHRHTAESNNARVLWWSLLVCGIFITVGVVQVVVIRRFFNSGKRKDKLRT